MRQKSFWLTAALLLVADRAVKLLCEGESFVLIPGVLRIQSTQNTGMALGLFSGSAVWVAVLSLLMLAACMLLLRKMPFRGLAAYSLGLMLGGALGNLIDRVIYGYVLDMFEVLFMNFYIFNVADIGVVVGAVLCAVSVLFRPEDWSKA